MNHSAILELYSDVVRVDTVNGVTTAYDENDNEVTFDTAAVETKAAELLVVAKLERLRTHRNIRLAESDWTQVPDSPLDDATKAEWVTYRQALRDITNTYSSLDDVVWPEKP